MIHIHNYSALTENGHCVLNIKAVKTQFHKLFLYLAQTKGRLCYSSTRYCANIMLNKKSPWVSHPQTF